MHEYAIYRRDSVADTGGKGRHHTLLYGVVKAPNHKIASDWAWKKFVRSSCQWIELENVKRLKGAKVRAARREAEYEIDENGKEVVSSEI